MWCTTCPTRVGALQRIRSVLADGGSYLMVEPKVADDLQSNLANPFARMLYGISCLHCVPQSLAQRRHRLGCLLGREARPRAGRTGRVRAL